MPTLNDLTIKQLKSLAKSYEFTGYSKLNKSDLIDFIKNHTNQLGFGQKKHKKKFLRREERRKNKKEYKRIEAEMRQKSKDEKEQKKGNLAEEKLVKKKRKMKKTKAEVKRKTTKRDKTSFGFNEKSRAKEKCIEETQGKRTC